MHNGDLSIFPLQQSFPGALPHPVFIMTSLGPIFADDLARVKPGDRLRLTISAQTSDAAALAQAALEARARGEPSSGGLRRPGRRAASRAGDAVV